MYLFIHSFISKEGRKRKRKERKKQQRVVAHWYYYLLPIANPSGLLTGLARVRVSCLNGSYIQLARSNLPTMITKVEVPCLGIG